MEVWPSSADSERAAAMHAGRRGSQLPARQPARGPGHRQRRYRDASGARAPDEHRRGDGDEAGLKLLDGDGVTALADRGQFGRQRRPAR